MLEVPYVRIPGVSCGVRDLTKKGTNEVWGHSVRVRAMGGTFEADVPKELVSQCPGDGSPVVIEATLTTGFNGGTRIVVTKFDSVTARKAA